ncbi:hypothetical protein A3A64_01135 [Candidatus Gottesmanbacteria bacterium RIFCSPLOWO2_01_FULL_48_11]|uniref:Beta-lactamase class A catalytic domain-containing protein n=1 Tax=Candidatus Gottesmanbacteria bacterium RIFCSPLOWO2_01_FULL_48_11 TaxID=1798395 RepID=A0A1F6ARK2_9BACT|nr:MAG: hypothetical protein A3A64_01135 [Candidatus Gottesmanbacteria bacterium RIFCSPLOWO2_01_FULL_48_11]
MYEYRREHTKKSFPLLPILTAFILSLVGVFIVSQKANSTIVSPLPNDAPSTFTFPNPFVRRRNPEELQKKIQAQIGNTWKNYSIYVKDYTSDFSMGINDTVIFTAASVNKIPIIAALYWQVQNQAIDLDTSVTIQASDVQYYGTGTIQSDPPGSTYSVKTLAKLMMQQSDNTAAYILANYTVGLDTIQTLVNRWGLTQTDIINNKTSNKDMEILMDKIYTGKITNTAYTQEMLAFFKDSDFEDRIPALLPKGTTVYHKIGTEVGVMHDAGIVHQGNLTYYIGIFTSDVSDEPTTIKLIAEISKAVYDYLR